MSETPRVPGLAPPPSFLTRPVVPPPPSTLIRPPLPPPPKTVIPAPSPRLNPTPPAFIPETVSSCSITPCDVVITSPTVPVPKIVTPATTTVTNESDVAWRRGFQQFIFAVLEPILLNPDGTHIPEYGRFVDKSAIKIWIQAFTHETVDYENNYEKLEFRGDAVLKAIFPLYLMDRYPQLDESELTELNRAYMSKINQSKLAQQLGFNQYIRIQGIDAAIVNIETDVFEAFFGALQVIGTSIHEGWGYLYCEKMVKYLFDGSDINLDLGEGAFKTVVNQIFRRFELGEPRMETCMPGREFSSQLIVSTRLSDFMENYVPSKDEDFLAMDTVTDCDPKTVKSTLVEIFYENMHKGGLVAIDNKRGEGFGPQRVTVSIVLLPEQIQFLMDNGVRVPQARYPGAKYVLATAAAPTKAAAEFNAYQIAHDKLRSWGVTKAWAADIKQRIDFQHPEIAPFVPSALSKLRSSGYEAMEFFIPRKLVTDMGAVVQLLGIKKGERDIKVPIATVYTNERTNGFLAGKIAVLQKYINS